MRRRNAILLWCAVATTAAPSASAARDLAERVAVIDRNASQRFLALAGTEQRAKHGAAALRAYARVLALDPENGTARRELGYRKAAAGGWTRDPEPEPDAPPAGAEEEKRAARFRAQHVEIEEWRAREIAKAATESGSPDEARPYLLPLLDLVPRLAEVHVALGHEKVGDRYVRPELLLLARGAPQVQQAWAACRTPEDEPKDRGEPFALPGLGSWPTWQVGGRIVRAAFDQVAEARVAARATEAVQCLVRRLLGDDVKSWDPSPIDLLPPKAYEAYVKERQTDPAEQRKRLMSASYLGKGFAALRCVAMTASDIYAHNVGYRTAQGVALPKPPKGSAAEGDTEHYAWFLEGLGYFMSLEVSDTATTSFLSFTESQRKVTGAPPPAKPSRATLTEWVRSRVLEGSAYPMNEVLGKTINSLDFAASMQAWTFVRFLALLDPSAFRRLPAALADQTFGSEPERADAAFLACYGKGAGDLARLWRAWLLEL